MISSGIDVGSKYVKVAVMNEEKDRKTGYGLSCIHRDVEKAIDQALEQAYASACVSKFSKKRFCITGDGYKKKHKYLEKSEAQCLASYFYNLDKHSPGEKEKLIIDAGNTFIDAIIVSKKGKILDSSTNDRCSAGCGRFIEIICKALSIDIGQIDAFYHESDKLYTITSGCIVFAESEVITQVNAGTSIPTIVTGIIHLIAGKISTMYERYYSNNTGIVYLAGGIAKIEAIGKVFEELTGAVIQTSPIDPQFASACGAALLAE